MFRRTYAAYTLLNGNVCNKKCSLDSAVQFIQQTNKSNNGSTCGTGSTCNTRAVIKIMGIMAACMAAMTLHSSGSTVNHFYDVYDTSNNHTILAPNELVGGCTTSPAKRTGVMCLLGAITAICLVFFICLIKRVFETVSR